MPGHGWTLKKFRQWVADIFGLSVCRNTIRQLLRRAGFTWKKVKKLLGRACPTKRQAFLDQLCQLYPHVCSQQVVLIYIDEAHFHRDMDLGDVWAKNGGCAWRVSDCLGLSERINWFGAYDFTRGRCLIWNEGPCNGASTKTFLQRAREWIGPTLAKIVIVWDGAPWHRAKIVTAQAKALGMELRPLPGYSPDLNPIEGLWKWMREDVTSGFCFG